MILISLDVGQFVDGVFYPDRFLNRIITTRAKKNLTLNWTKTKFAAGDNQLMDLSNGRVTIYHHAGIRQEISKIGPKLWLVQSDNC